MPCYNAEKVLPNSLESISLQRFRDFEVVFVEDGSSDRTVELLNRFVSEVDFPCQVVVQPYNQGVAAARNRGVEVARGDYLAFVDADDRIEPGALEEAAKVLECDNSIDIIGWDWMLCMEKSMRAIRQNDYDTPLQALKNLMGGTMRWNLWLFAVRRNLLLENGIRFIPGANMGEDMMLMLKAFSCAEKVIQVHKPLYLYNAVSETSLSRQFSTERRQEISKNLGEAERYLKEGKFASVLHLDFQYLKLYLKRPLLISSDKSDYEIWYNWFPEVNRYAMSNKALPLHTRILQGMAAKRFWLGVKLYYVLIHKFVYGVLYN